MELKLSRCRNPRCGRKVYFLPDENGKIQCLDAVAPVFIVDHAEGGTADGKDYSEASCRRDKMAFVSHFSTCKYADDFSKKRARG